MHLLKLQQHLPLYFSLQDIQEALTLKPAATRMLAMRYTKNKIFLRLRRDLYMFADRFRHLVRYDLFPISAAIQENSYISFSSALLYYGVFKGYPSSIEAMCPQRSALRRIQQMPFHYYKLPKKYFFSFVDYGTFKMATAEKALLDLLYLYSLGRYYVPLRHFNLEAVDLKKLAQLAQDYPPRTQKILKRITRSVPKAQ